VAFYSKSLSPVERNYEIHDKEMLAIIHALEEWRHFLKGARHLVEIWTDHKNLEYFMTAKKLNRRQARWFLYLARFDFKFTHCPGCSMGKPDTLSRRPDHGKGTSDNEDVVLLQLELSKGFSRKVWRGTSSKKFVKGTRKATRKSQWQRRQENSGKHRVKRSVPRSGQKTMEYSSSEARSTFPGTRTYEGE